MPALLSAAEICETALRKIGAYSINDMGADGEELKEAAKWLDLVVSEMVATERCTWLIEDTVTIPLLAGVATYNLADAMGVSYPSDGVLFFTSAWIQDGSNDVETEMIRRHDFEEITLKTATGKPETIYIDRLSDSASQSFTIYPIPIDTSYNLKIVFQRSSPDLKNDVGTKAHGFHLGWQKWLVVATAAEIGDGPVRRLPSAEVDRHRRDAQMSFDKLQAVQNRENIRPRRVAAWGA